MDQIKATDEINCSSDLLQQFGSLYMKGEHSDVTLLVEDTPIPVHKFVLSVRSEYFRSMFTSSFTESTQNEIKLHVPLVAFKVVLKYFYTGCVLLKELNVQQIIDAMDLFNQYCDDSNGLKLKIAEHLETIVTVDNCLPIYGAAMLFSLDSLEKACETIIDRNATVLLCHETFEAAPEELICGLLKRDTFFEDEINIFHAVKKWIEENSTVNSKNVVSLIRWHLMTMEELFTVVRNSGILKTEEFLNAVESKVSSNTLPLRYKLPEPNQNIASSEYGTKLVCEKSNLSNDFDGGVVDDSNAEVTDVNVEEGCIIAELSEPSMINHMQILSDRSFYVIETSIDRKNYELVDFNEQDRQLRYFYFPSRVVRYIKLSGLNETRCPKILGVKAMFSPLTFINGIIKPNFNVASTSMGAKVLNGIGKDNLLNGVVDQYDGGSGYTCHYIGEGSILIQLDQQYIIDSMRLLLWDLDDRTYSFYIETSTDNENYEMAVDKRDEKLTSWQQFKFELRPVVYIKITGTYNSANKGFHCVHFESPSQAN